MLLQKLKKKRRGQIRAIDFTVSLFLFLLMLSQLILIIINIQFGIRSSKIGNLVSEDIDIFSNQFLHEEGDAHWGYKQTLPTTFGLADSNTLSVLTLDAAKIARLITGTTFPITSVSGFEMYDYKTLEDSISLDSKYEFQLAFLPCLVTNSTISNIINNSGTFYYVKVDVTNPFSESVADVMVNFFSIDLTNGQITLEGTSSTDSNGESNLTYQIDPLIDQIVFLFVEKDSLWGLSWEKYDPFNRVNIGSPSGTTIWGGAVNSSTILITDILKEPPDSHFLSIVYKNTQSGFSNEVIDFSQDIAGNETFSVPNKGVISYFSIARKNDGYFVRVGSYPAILDRGLSSGEFFQVFGTQNPRKNLETMLSKIYPVIVRGTIMRCQLTLWSE
ncbi:MAG: hypothetical protein ACXAC8_00075 [Candidatus Hodarchaeales archaeon]|jgi:hypothetical protein